MQDSQPQRGEIWAVNLDPTIGSEIKKTRPAVVINAHLFDLVDTRIVVPLTTWQSRFANQANKVRVPRSEQNGLDSDSAADFLQVRCVSTQRFITRKGALEADLLEEIVAGVAIAVDYQP